MPEFKLPLSGNITQTINPWTMLFDPVGSQVGLFNINFGISSNPAVEKRVLSDVASYGKQLGRIGDVLQVLLAHFHPQQPLSPAETASIADLKRMLDEIGHVKRQHTTGSTNVL